MKRFLIGVCFLVIFIPGVWFIAIPDSLIIGMLENSIRSDGLRVETEGFRKGLFLNFAIERVSLKKGGNSLFSIEDITGRVSLLSLLLLRLDMSFGGNIGKGKVSGDIDTIWRDNRISLHIDEVDIEGIPFLGLVGVRGSGMFSGDFRVKGNKGELKFLIKDARFKSISFSGVPVPMGMFHSAKGMMVINKGIIDVRSFTLEGKDIYARLKGNVRDGNLDMRMEVMPDPSSVYKTFLSIQLGRYNVSPGYYVIPISGEVASGL